MMTSRKVGYGSPPEHSRFQKGRSGNPSGRPRKVPSLAQDLAAELAETVQITESGRPRKISKQRALLKAVMAHGIKGNAAAAKLLLNYCVQLIKSEPDQVADALTPADQQILEDYLAREVARRHAKANDLTPIDGSTSRAQTQKDSDQ